MAKPFVPETPVELFAFTTSVCERTQTASGRPPASVPGASTRIPPAPVVPNFVKRTSSSASVWFAGTVTRTGWAPLLSPSALFDPSSPDAGRKYMSTGAAVAFGLTMRSDVT